MSSKGTPQISVVLPVRDAGQCIEACIRSVQAQTFECFELLCVDDGSRDDGPARVARMARDDARIRILHGPGGLVAALNLGLSRARGALVARMDADDLMHPRRLELQHAHLHGHPSIALVASRVEAFPREELGRGMLHYLRWQDGCLTPERIARDIYVESPLVHPSVLFRRDCVIELGGYLDGPFPEDYELWLRMTRAGLSLAKLGQRLLRWRQHPGSLSRSDPRYGRSAFDCLRARYLAEDARLAVGRELVIWGAGRRTRRRVDRLAELGHRPSAFIDIDPRKVGNRVQGVWVHPPSWLAGRQVRPLVLGYVASHGAREAIHDALVTMGYRPGEDFLMVG